MTTTGSTPSFARDIPPLFRESDRESMDFAFDLWNYQDVRTHAEDILDLASSEPVNINVFPNFSLLGNHIQVFEPISVDETNVTWYGTAVVDEAGALGEALADVNTLRMRTMEQFPNFGEVDDLANFEEIQRGLACQEDEWVYMHRGLGIPGRVQIDAEGIIRAPATDEDTIGGSLSNTLLTPIRSTTRLVTAHEAKRSM